MKTDGRGQPAGAASCLASGAWEGSEGVWEEWSRGVKEEMGSIGKIKGEFESVTSERECET